MRSFKQDYRTGISNEMRCLDFFNYYFDEIFKKTPPTHSFDFETDKRFIELKSRTCLASSYPTTMVGMDKIKIASQCDKPVHFAFLFNDGSLYEIEYNAEIFKNFETRLFQRNDRIDHQDVCKEYCYIPVRLLEEIGNVSI